LKSSQHIHSQPAGNVDGLELPIERWSIEITFKEGKLLSLVGLQSHFIENPIHAFRRVKHNVDFRANVTPRQDPCWVPRWIASRVVEHPTWLQKLRHGLKKL
jgi:hypothetical protein